MGSPETPARYDIAVVVLDAPASGIAPARLPTLNRLDTASARAFLDDFVTLP